MKTSHGPALVIFGYNRVDEFKQMWKGVIKATNCFNRSLYIFIDGPKNSITKDYSPDLIQIVEQDKNRFITTEIVIRKVNFGLKGNIENGLDYVFSKEEAALILEDDIVVAESAFLYVDSMIKNFSTNRFGAISLYQYPIPFQNKYSYACTMYSCWGWATTATRWNDYRRNIEFRTNLGLNSWLQFNQGIYSTYIEQLIANQKGVLNTWFIHWYLYNFVMNYSCIYPAKSLSRNIGFNEKGSNCEVATSEYDIEYWKELSFVIRKIEGRPYSNFFKKLHMNRLGIVSVLVRYLRLYL